MKIAEQLLCPCLQDARCSKNSRGRRVTFSMRSATQVRFFLSVFELFRKNQAPYIPFYLSIIFYGTEDMFSRLQFVNWMIFEKNR